MTESKNTSADHLSLVGSGDEQDKAASIIFCGQRIKFHMSEFPNMVQKGKETLVHSFEEGISYSEAILEQIGIYYSSEGDASNLKEAFAYCIGAMSLHQISSNYDSGIHDLINRLTEGDEPVLIPYPASGIPSVFSQDHKFTITLNGHDLVFNAVEFCRFMPLTHGVIEEPLQKKSGQFFKELGEQGGAYALDEIPRNDLIQNLMILLDAKIGIGFPYMINQMLQKDSMEIEIQLFESGEDLGGDEADSIQAEEGNETSYGFDEQLESFDDSSSLNSESDNSNKGGRKVLPFGKSPKRIQ